MGPVVDPETGFLYLRARYYDPNTAQFLTPDPLYAITGERYGYAGNDPINGDDPTGLWCLVHNSSGGCKGAHVVHDVAAAPGHIAHDVNNDVVKTAAHTCVAVGNPNCESYSSTKNGHAILVGAELVLGASLLVASFGTLAAPGAGAFGLTATQTSGFIAWGAAGSAGLNMPRCLAGDRVACAAAALGGAGAGLSFAGALGATSEWGVAAGAFGRVSGLLGWTLNGTYRLWGAVCHR